MSYTTSKAVLMLALKIARSLEQDYADYLESCESYRRDGYTPHYCEHGTNRWTDYDNICGPCEDGLSMRDGLTRREYALDAAKRRDAKCREIVKAASNLRELVPGWEIPSEVWAEVTRLLTVE